MKKMLVLYLAILTVLLVFQYRALSRMSIEKDQAYIDKHKSLAILEMRIFRIPASITLAQALIESDAGSSELAVNANNHFGIKCKTDWWGETYTHTDDLPDECFRAYATVSDSYRDHSVFISGRKWYNFLFKLDIHDYKGWAHGLKKAGYATDKNYAYKLIGKIEAYKLQDLDK